MRGFFYFQLTFLFLIKLACLKYPINNFYSYTVTVLEKPGL